MEASQKEKAAQLQHAVINYSVEEISKRYEELGSVEMTAPALGLACRFRGLGVVKALVERGVLPSSRACRYPGRIPSRRIPSTVRRG